ncbi:ribonuclease H-like domain-containing protein [Tanacetum coccineum]
MSSIIPAFRVVESEILYDFPRFFGVLIAELAVGGAVNFTLKMNGYMIIENLNLESKIDAMSILLVEKIEQGNELSEILPSGDSSRGKTFNPNAKLESPRSDKDVMLILFVYVDDIIVTGNNIDEINKFKQFFGSKFLLKDLGKFKYFLGIEVLDVPEGICLTQRKYYTELLTEFGMLACKPRSTPIEVNPDGKKVVCKFGDDVPINGITNYQKLVGKLIYLTMTRLGISYVVHCLSQVMHNPMQSHLRLAFRVLKYLKREPRLGITFKENDNIDLKVFVDSDWAKCKVTRRSITGYVVFLGNSLVF